MNEIERVARAVHEELSHINIMAYLDMPTDTAERVATAAIAAMRGEPDSATDAENQRLRAEVEALREALVASEQAIAEYYRYWTGGETRGSYDGKPERNGLWNAMYKARAALIRKAPQ